MEEDVGDGYPSRERARGPLGDPRKPADTRGEEVEGGQGRGDQQGAHETCFGRESSGYLVAVLGPLSERESLVDRLVRERGATRPSRRLEDLPAPLTLGAGETDPSAVLARQRAERLREG